MKNSPSYPYNHNLCPSFDQWTLQWLPPFFVTVNNAAMNMQYKYLLDSLLSFLGVYTQGGIGGYNCMFNF